MAGNGPLREQRLFLRRAVLPAVQASESPCIGRFAQLGGVGIAFDVSANRQKMLVILHRKGFISALVEVPVANRIVVSVMPLRVSQREPLGEPGHLAVETWTYAKMPVIGHDAIAKKVNLVTCDRFAENTFKGFVILVLEEQFVSPIGAVEHVVNATGLISTLRSTHSLRSLEVITSICVEDNWVTLSCLCCQFGT